MNFKLLNNKRYISDGDENTIVVQDKDKNLINDKFSDLRIVTY